MLAIITTHPIQYQVPLWQAMAKDGRVPFEVWYLTDFGTRPSQDKEFGKTFAWDIDMLSGYPFRFLETAPGAIPTSFFKCRLQERLRDRLKASGVTAVWIQGWQVLGYWQAVWEAKAAGVEVWLRAESNNLAPTVWWKQPIKRALLGSFFKRIDEFLYIGSGNKDLYQDFGVKSAHLHPAPYAIDNQRFAGQAAHVRSERGKLRRNWGIPEDAFCVLFCGKFVAKKRPMDIVRAASQLIQDAQLPNVHLLFVGSGELGSEIRDACKVVYDADASGTSEDAARGHTDVGGPRPSASFVGFLNQTEISRAYVAADCLVLPSDHGETWGLVVNEALASGLPCAVSRACGCAQDLIARGHPELTFDCGDISGIAKAIASLASKRRPPEEISKEVADHTFERTVQAALALGMSPRKSAAIADPGTAGLAKVTT